MSSKDHIRGHLSSFEIKRVWMLGGPLHREEGAEEPPTEGERSDQMKLLI